MKVSELRQLIREQVKQILAQPLNENFAVTIKDIHFETDPVKAETLKKAYGKSTGELFPSKQIASANYALAKYRKQIGYDNGKSGTAGSTDVFVPHSSMAAFSTVGNGPHSKPMKWNRKEYDKWIKGMAGDGGANNAYDMAQNAKHEPGLIDWVKRNVANGENPLERIQWDIEAYT